MKEEDLKKVPCKEIRERMERLCLELDEITNELEELEQELKRRGLEVWPK